MSTKSRNVGLDAKPGYGSVCVLCSNIVARSTF